MRPFLILSLGLGVAGILVWRIHHRGRSPKRHSPSINPHLETSSIVCEGDAVTSSIGAPWLTPKSCIDADNPADEPDTQIAQSKLIENGIEQLLDSESQAVQPLNPNTEPRDETSTFIRQNVVTQSLATLDNDDPCSGMSFEESMPTSSEELNEPDDLVEIEAQNLRQPVQGLSKDKEFSVIIEDHLPESDSSGVQAGLVSAPILPPVEESQGESLSANAGTNFDSIDTNVETKISEVSQPEDLDNATRAPSRYRPPQQRPAGAPVTSTNMQSRRAKREDILLRVKVRLTFDHQSFCEIAFLPERLPDLDDEVLVKLQDDSLRLVAQEEWYQDIQLDDPSEFLRNGLELKGRIADARRIRWVLTGRDLYVLANHPRASGFISTDRLVLGRTHVVLCVEELLADVETLLAVAGCAEYVKLDDTYGVPHGWVALRNVSPTKAIVLDPGSDPFYSIKPAPDIDIELTGGICLRNSVWLSGYAPHIRIVGEFDETIKVRIDQREAHLEADGSFVVDGYDDVGPHSVYCEGLSCSCSYSIEEPPDSWEEWDAYVFGANGICGSFVRRAPGAEAELPFVVPMTNLLLLGAKPGQIFRCTSRRVKQWKGFVPFEVVWALPIDPLRCDKRVARILAYNPSPVMTMHSTALTLEWAKAILDTSRKGLRFSTEDSDTVKRWKEYKKIARRIWKAQR